MSGKAAQPEAQGEDGGKKKGKKLILIIVALVVVLAGGGGAAWFFLLRDKGDHGKPGEAGHAVKAEEHKEKSAPPVFVTLEPFVVNLTGDGPERYLQVGIDVKVSDAETSEAIKAHLPEVKNGILLILSSKRADELGTLEGKNKLREEIRDAVNRPIGQYHPPAEGHAAEPPTKGALDVLLTSFVIQ